MGLEIDVDLPVTFISFLSLSVGDVCGDFDIWMKILVTPGLWGVGLGEGEIADLVDISAETSMLLGRCRGDLF